MFLFLVSTSPVQDKSLATRLFSFLILCNFGPIKKVGDQIFTRNWTPFSANCVAILAHLRESIHLTWAQNPPAYAICAYCQYGNSFKPNMQRLVVLWLTLNGRMWFTQWPNWALEVRSRRIHILLDDLRLLTTSRRVNFFSLALSSTSRSRRGFNDSFERNNNDKYWSRNIYIIQHSAKCTDLLH